MSVRRVNIPKAGLKGDRARLSIDLPVRHVVSHAG